MLNKKIFKASDVRGIYPNDINAEALQKINAALALIWQKGHIIIAHDGRHGSAELAQLMKTYFEQLPSKPFTIEFVGLATTPMFYFLVNHLNAVGGAMLTASHNPKEYTGVKAVGIQALPVPGTLILKTIENHGL